MYWFGEGVELYVVVVVLCLDFVCEEVFDFEGVFEGNVLDGGVEVYCCFVD